jgi:hypothetical protein
MNGDDRTLRDGDVMSGDWVDGRQAFEQRAELRIAGLEERVALLEHLLL